MKVFAMANEPEDDIARLWREQPGEGGTMPLSEIKAKARKLGRTIRAQILLEYAGAVIVFIAFGRMAIIAQSPIVAIGAGLVIVATGFVVVYMHRKSWVSAAAVDGLAENGVEFYRAALLRQRDVLRSVWWWYLLPFAPGLMFILIGRAAADPERAPRAAGSALICLLVFLGLGKLNERAARKLQREIDVLDAKNT